MTLSALCAVFCALVASGCEPLLDSDAGADADAEREAGADGSLAAPDRDAEDPVADDAGPGSTDLRCQASAAAPQGTDYAQPGPHQVGLLEVTFEDESRPIVATDKHAAAPARTLVTSIYYPAAAAATLFEPAALAAGGPFPMLMYSHGMASGRGEAEPIARRAASHGFVVVAPDFPLTNLLANYAAPDAQDGANQPADISFLIDQLLALSADPQHLLANAVDGDRIGALGVSLGGFTTLVVGFHPKLLERRIKAVAPIAPLSSFFAQGFYHTHDIPILFIHGDLDAFVSYALNARRAFTRAAPNARLVTIKRGTHAAFAVQEDPALLNALLGAPGADPSNPDGYGCGAAGEALRKEGASFLLPLGGPENFIEYDVVNEPLLPCQGDEYTKPAIDPTLQVELAARGTVAFFDAQLGNSAEKRRDGCRYLLYELSKHPSASVE